MPGPATYNPVMRPSLGQWRGVRRNVAAAAPWTPADITGLQLFLQYDAAHCTPHVVGDPVDSISASYGTTRTASQTLTLRALFRANGLEYGPTGFMALSSATALAGALTSYHVFNLPAGDDIYVVGSVSTPALIGVSAGNITVLDDLGFGTNLGALTGVSLIRVSVDGSGNITVKATGGQTTTQGGQGASTFEVTGASPNNGVFSGSTANRSLCDIIKTGDNSGTAEDTNILAWILATYGASL